MSTSTTNGVPQIVSAQATVIAKRAYAGSHGTTKLLHVNLPADLVNAVRSLAQSERRTITSQVALLLEESPDLVDWQNDR